MVPENQIGLNAKNGSGQGMLYGYLAGEWYCLPIQIKKMNMLS